MKGFILRRAVIGLGLLILSANFSACKVQSVIDGEPNAELISYLPDDLASYEGDGAYYHVVQSIESFEEEHTYRSVLKGEVKDLTPATQYVDHTFEIELTVDAETLTQKISGIQLNDSLFKELILLKSPVEEGHEWSFNTKDQDGKIVKVTGIIISTMEESESIIVRHTLATGYYEERTIQKSKGVTSFSRPVAFKNESAVTGYHKMEQAVDEPIKTEALEERIEIPTKLYALIYGFNRAWQSYLNDESNEVFDFIVKESKADIKITAVDRSLTTAVEFVSFYPYDFVEESSNIWVYVVETYRNMSNELIETKVMYQVMNIDLNLKIVDFNQVK